ncbi:HtpB [Mycoplasma phage phiMFV1]|uniref:htpb n=1 Tax=Mycoplasma phage phiMFV1 TaxID=280702 RepID=UPI00003B49CE|nr:htpb [Mycoplasma phage phiMFV1]AAT65069.1 HtpB [Mycoplasma phage phiMFV1]
MEELNKLEINLNEFKSKYWYEQNLTIPYVFKKQNENLNEVDFFSKFAYSIYTTIDLIIGQKMSYFVKTQIDSKAIKNIIGETRFDNFKKAIYLEIKYRLSSKSFPEYSNSVFLVSNNISLNDETRDFGSLSKLINYESIQLLTFPSWVDLESDIDFIQADFEALLKSLKEFVNNKDIELENKIKSLEEYDKSQTQNNINQEKRIKNLEYKTNVIKNESEINLKDNEHIFYLWGNGFGIQNTKDKFIVFNYPKLKKLDYIINDYDIEKQSQETLKQAFESFKIAQENQNITNGQINFTQDNQIKALEYKVTALEKTTPKNERLTELDKQINALNLEMKKVNSKSWVQVAKAESTTFEYGQESMFLIDKAAGTGFVWEFKKFKIVSTIDYAGKENKFITYLDFGDELTFCQPVVYDDIGSSSSLAIWNIKMSNESCVFKIIQIGKIYNNETPGDLRSWKLEVYSWEG